MPRGFKIFLTKVVSDYVFPLVSAAMGLKFKLADNPDSEGLDKAYGVAWEVYGKELGYFDPKDHSDGKYSDKYDEYSVVFLCLLRGKPVGTLRLIRDSSLGFYIERDFPIIPPSISRHQIVELSRFAVLKEHRGGMHLISFGLLRSALKFSQSNGITHWYALMGESLKKSFDRYGVSINLLPYGELTQEQIQERKSMEDYYKRIKPLPYIISLKEIQEIL